MSFISINNRRYLGNKYKLIDFLKSITDKECLNFTSFADIFAGTGAVASAYTDKRIITYDILYSNYLCHITWFLNKRYDDKLIKEYIDYFNSSIPYEDNYMSDNFSDTYFSRSICSKIGFIREIIEKEYRNDKINIKEYSILITSLIYSVDKIANTCGHYDSYRKKIEKNKELKLAIPLLNYELMDNNECYNCDSNELVSKINADVVYIDPPYNSRQYCDAYHLIENLAKWEKPVVKGVAKKMDRQKLKSKYCTRQAPLAFFNLISNIKSRYILVSYNNMARKGNDRSNARISDEEIINALESRGVVKIYSKPFRAFTAGKANYEDNRERLFLCKVGQSE